MSVLNLASQPFRNERLPALLFLGAAFGLLLVTGQHALIVYRLRPGASRALHSEVADLRQERVKLEEESGRLQRVVATQRQRTEWAALRDLVDRRTFRWSHLFQILESILPNDVRILAVSPRINQGKQELGMVIRVQNSEAGYGFIDVLSRSRNFSAVVAKNVDPQASGEIELQLTMNYVADDGDEKANPAVSR